MKVPEDPRRNATLIRRDSCHLGRQSPPESAAAGQSLPATRQHIAGGDTPEENHFALVRELPSQKPRVTLDRHSVTRIVLMNVDLRKFTQIIEMNSRSRIDQAACRRDHKHT
jgi:hypothetical protein